MLSQEFVSGYQRDVTGAASLSTKFAELMTPAAEWSADFGKILYDRLADPQGEISVRNGLTGDYVGWSNAGAVAIAQQLSLDQGPDSLKANMELNFHRLNGVMLGMWQPIVNPEAYGDADFSRSVIPFLQDVLAITGLRHYMERNRVSGSRSQLEYFADENRERRNYFEGIGNEIDAAIVLLEFARHHPDLTVVPAPSQFSKRSNQNGVNRNANFVVATKDGRALGVQVSSFVTPELKARYDADRIVLVDGRVDLGNQRAVRTDPRRSAKSVQVWSCIIAAARARNFQAHGPRISQFREAGMFGGNEGERQLMNMSRIARQLLNGVRPRTREAVQVVGERILEHL